MCKYTGARVRKCMTTPWSETGLIGPKDKWTLQLIEEMNIVADRMEELEATNAELLEALRKIADGTDESWAANIANQAIRNAEEAT